MDRERDRFFKELFEAHGHLVFRRARSILGNDADAEEATQEVFVRAMLRYETFRHDSAVGTWLYKVTTNHCLNTLRDRKRRRELRDENAEQLVPRAPGSAVSPSGMVLLRDLLQQADEQQARAAVCVFMDGMSLQQTADHLDVSKRSVSNLISRFRTWARKRAAR